MGTVYAVRAGIGAFGIALWGMAAEGEPASATGIACLALIPAGVAGRNPPVCLAVSHGGGARSGARTGQWTGPLP